MLGGLFIHFSRRLAGSGLLTWTMAASVLAVPAEKVFTVRRGDTLDDIARQHGLSTARLAERNGLSRNYYVYAGQRLVIPARASARVAPTPPGAGLPASVQRAIDDAEVKPGRWKYIVIHHSGVDCGTLSGIDRYHREERHMENGLGYHFVLGNGNGMGDGEIGVGPRWTKQLEGGHLISRSQNKISLGIVTSYGIYVLGYVITQVLTPVLSSAGFFFENLVGIIPQILASGLLAALIGGVMAPVLFFLRDVDISRLRNQVYYPAAIGISALCWIVVVSNSPWMTGI